MKRILIPVGLGDTTAKVLQQGHRMARAFGSKIRLLHILKVPNIVAERKLPKEVREQREQEIAELRRELEAQAEALIDDGIAVEAVVLEGNDAADVIIEQARDFDAELIIMGSHGRSLLVGTILGDVAIDVVRQSPCPVYIVPMSMLEPETDGKAENVES